MCLSSQDFINAPHLTPAPGGSVMNDRFGDDPYFEWFSFSASYGGLAESSALIENTLAMQVRDLGLGCA